MTRPVLTVYCEVTGTSQPIVRRHLREDIPEVFERQIFRKAGDSDGDVVVLKDGKGDYFYLGCRGALAVGAEDGKKVKLSAGDDAALKIGGGKNVSGRVIYSRQSYDEMFVFLARDVDNYYPDDINRAPVSLILGVVAGYASGMFLGLKIAVAIGAVVGLGSFFGSSFLLPAYDDMPLASLFEQSI